MPNEVSVIIPTHNRRDRLRLTLRSVLRQRDVDLEVIVVDDGSTDGTRDLIGGVADTRLRLIHHDAPLGVSASRNHGAREARGMWLAFIDDDDLWAPDKLARQLDAARVTGRAWVYTGSVNIDDGAGIVSGSPPVAPEQVARTIRSYNVIPGGGSNVIVRRDEFEGIGPFELRLKNTEDWEMWIRLSEHGPPACVPRPLMAYRVHAGNASLDVAAILEGVSLIERMHATRADRGMIHRWISESCLRTGQRTEAVKHLGIAALRGQGFNVAGDVLTILKRHLSRYLPGPAVPARRHPEWIEEARRWLDGLVSTEK